MESITAKNFSDCYLYSLGPYEKAVFEFMSRAQSIDQNSKEFQDVVYDLKRRSASTSVLKALMHEKTVLLDFGIGLPKSFKVFTAKDIRSEGDHTRKVFIDVSTIIENRGGLYDCPAIDILTAYSISAMTQLIYYSDPRRLVMNSSLVKSTVDCFCSLMNYLMGYMRINGYSGAKEKILYLSAIYVQLGIMMRPKTDSVITYAKQAARLTDKDVQVLDVLYSEEDMHDIKSFVNMLKKVLHLNDLTLELFIDRWIYLFGTGTQFACELFPSLATMLTNAYCGVYLNNVKTIERQVGAGLAEFSTTLFRIGSESL